MIPHFDPTRRPRVALTFALLALSLPAAAQAANIIPPKPLIPLVVRSPDIGLERSVVVILTVSSEGRVTDLELESSGTDALRTALIEAGKEWTFLPASHDGFPVAARVRAIVKLVGEHTLPPPGVSDPSQEESRAAAETIMTPPAAEVEHPVAINRNTTTEESIEVTVTAERSASEAASRVSYGVRELQLRPRLRTADVVEAVPGLLAVQHAGGGKANQYFLRGFDADHGTDIAFFVDGVPVNMPSHAHGQGYTDFNFLIPELVTGLEGYKGPYYTSLGDFATAGALNLRLAEKFEQSYVQYTIGQFGVMRGLLVASPELDEKSNAVVAADVYKEDGPFLNPEQLSRFNVFARATRDVGKTGKVSLTLMSYGSSWYGSGQIPARAICGEGESQNPPPATYGQPCLDRFGSVDPTEGGATQRQMVSLAYTGSSRNADVSALAYLIRYRFTLYSNFTFFKDHPFPPEGDGTGDQIEQNDDRSVIGTDVRVRQHAAFAGATFMSSLGIQARADEIDNALYHDVARQRLSTTVSSHIARSDIAAFAEEDAHLARWLRVIVGIRSERIDVNVDDRLHSAGPTSDSGLKGSSLILPKFMAVLSPLQKFDLFLDAGRGFHSNDARGAVLGSNAASLMTPAWGYEVGASLRPTHGLSIQTAAFVLDLDSELVWDGDSGTTVPSGRTRRLGVEIGGRYHLNDWLFADADATFTRARYRLNAGNGSAVALAPTRTFTAGIGAHPTFGNISPFVALRVKAVADRAAIEDGSLTAQGFTVFDANSGVRWRNVEGAIDVQNVFDVKWREAQFANQSRLAYEPAAVTGIHYTPGWPRTVMGKATLYWP